MTSAREQLVGRLHDKEYREEYVSEHIGQGLAFQIRATRKKRGWTQHELGARIAMAQEYVSKLENPDYGQFTLSTLKRLAEAFDCALIVRFAPFSQLIDWSMTLGERDIAVTDFANDSALQETHGYAFDMLSVPVQLELPVKSNVKYLMDYKRTENITMTTPEHAIEISSSTKVG